MAPRPEMCERFRSLHVPGRPLLLPNPWDVGSARLLASLGFEALATTSAGFAGTLGRLDGSVSREEALEHAEQIVGATDLPVSADLEDGYAREPGRVAGTVAEAVEVGLAGCSIEDAQHGADEPIYELGLAVERVEAAVDAAHRGEGPFVLTARAENHLYGRNDLSDTIQRLQAYQEAGADVLYAPGLTDAGDLARVLASVDRPVNVLALPGAPTVAELAELGVARISVGSGFSLTAAGALVGAAKELLEQGTYGFWATAGEGMQATRAAYDG